MSPIILRVAVFIDCTFQVYQDYLSDIIHILHFIPLQFIDVLQQAGPSQSTHKKPEVGQAILPYQ